MNLAHWLERQAATEPERPAVFHGTTQVLSYGQWCERAQAWAARLRQDGLVAGDRIALFLPNHPRYLEVLFGAWWAGLVVVPINSRLHLKELAWIVDNAGAAWVLTSQAQLADPATEPALRAVGVRQVMALDGDVDLPTEAPASVPIQARAPDDIAWLFYTSGTTGRPKGVMLTHRNLRTMSLGYCCDVDAITPNDAIVYAGPMSHGAGLYALPHVMRGARHVVPLSGGFDAAEVVALGLHLGPLSGFAAPTIVKRLVDYYEQHGLGPEHAARCFKTIVYGGAPMYRADIERALRVMGPRWVQIYGQGESPMVGTVLSREVLAAHEHPDYHARIASIGVAQSPVRVQVLDDAGQVLPAGVTGEVVIQGDSVMAGYWRNPQATQETVRDNWLWTGDRGFQSADGFITLRDRSKDLIISGGSNIYPREIEEVLLQLEGVLEVAVIGVPDPEWGETVLACVVRAPGSDVDETKLDEHCRQHLGRFKRPKRYEWVGELPKNNYGKVLKTSLRAMYAVDSSTG